MPRSTVKPTRPPAPMPGTERGQEVNRNTVFAPTTPQQRPLPSPAHTATSSLPPANHSLLVACMAGLIWGSTHLVQRVLFKQLWEHVRHAMDMGHGATVGMATQRGTRNNQITAQNT
jgi:hypothetical protein